MITIHLTSSTVANVHKQRLSALSSTVSSRPCGPNRKRPIGYDHKSDSEHRTPRQG